MLKASNSSSVKKAVTALQLYRQSSTANFSSRALSGSSPSILRRDSSISLFSINNNSPRQLAPYSPLFVSSVRHLRSGSDPKSIVDAKLASYGVENPIYAVVQLAQTTMRSELGKITLDKTFEERDTLNLKIVEAINVAAQDWGLTCLRYEIKDISPPRGVRIAMEMQAEAERKKRAQVLESEGERQANINKAQGEAQAILAKAGATAESIQRVSEALRTNGGMEAASLKIAEEYIRAFGNIAKESTTMLLPSTVSDPASMMGQAFSMYKNLIVKNVSHNGSSPALLEDNKEFNDEHTKTKRFTGTADFSDNVEFSLQSPKKRE
ncbi:hypothetical protein ACFE04_018784 [Oxalis oulophora]